MRAVDIIIKKRDGGELNPEEIEFFVKGFTQGEIPDYQVSAWAMAVVLRGMTDQEATDLAMAMAHSGEVLDLSKIGRIVVDKHSTGGVGDKTTLVVGPVVSACGLPVGKMSGRGLGFSGGTIDKMEAIPGFRVNLNPQQFIDQLCTLGIVVTGQSANLAPADGKLYALRDVTGTVQSIPLIASSVMSKKIASGAQAILLDVKVGSGAFMETLEKGQQLARLMVSIGKLSNRRVIAVLSDMNQPLGEAVGNAIELKEAIQTLIGNGPQDFMEHCLAISSYMLVLGNLAGDLKIGQEMAEQALMKGSAWKRFRELVIAQNGDVRFVDEPDRLPKAGYIETVCSPHTGFIAEVNARKVGEAAVELGAGRSNKADKIDMAVGVEILHKVGEKIDQGSPLFVIHASQKEKLAKAKEDILSAYKWSEEKTAPLPLFYGFVE